MRWSIKTILLTVILVNSSSTFAMAINQRCNEINQQSLFTQTYNAEQTDRIVRWVLRCYPKYADNLEKNQNVYAFDANYQPVLRKAYPVFVKVVSVDDPQSIFGKKDVLSNPNGYEYPIAEIDADHTTAPCNIPEGYTLEAFCGAGCFKPDQLIWFPDGDMSIQEAEKQSFAKVMTLGENATFENLDYQITEILDQRFIKSKQDQKESLVTLKTSGKSLSVTLNHPMLMPSGAMKNAGDLVVGDSLVNVDGETEAIVAIEKSSFYGKVMNLETRGKNVSSHIISAQGILTGDFMIQNLEVSNANRFLLRNRTFPVEILK